ncbi:MAG: MnhB domain-containing protein [Desulfurococcaceae archaeon]
MNRRTTFLLIILTLDLAIAIALAFTGLVTTPVDIKQLGLFYIENSFFGEMSAMTPEVVSSIVWDYRGLDTIYETAVFFLAIVAGLAVFGTVETSSGVSKGLTNLAKTATKLMSLLIISVSASIALHGHLTPGGGFQGGSALAVTPLLLIPTFSVYELVNRGVTTTRLLAARGLALASIGLIALLPVFRGLEIATNTRFYPAYFMGQLISGSLFFYNIFEYLAVASGFAAIFLYISIPERCLDGEISRGGG